MLKVLREKCGDIFAFDQYSWGIQFLIFMDIDGLVPEVGWERLDPFPVN